MTAALLLALVTSAGHQGAVAQATAIILPGARVSFASAMPALTGHVDAAPQRHIRKRIDGEGKASELRLLEFQ